MGFHCIIKLNVSDSHGERSGSMYGVSDGPRAEGGIQRVLFTNVGDHRLQHDVRISEITICRKTYALQDIYNVASAVDSC